MGFDQVVFITWDYTLGQLDAVVWEPVVYLRVKNVNRRQVHVGPVFFQVKLLVFECILLRRRNNFPIISFLYREIADFLQIKGAVKRF